MRIALLLLSLALFGCASSPAPSALPRTDGEWRTLYVVNHGLHTGLVIDRADLLEVLPGLAEASGGGDFIELGWGDEDFYRAPQATLGLTLRALLWPTASVLHVLPISDNPGRGFAASEVVAVRASEGGYRQLLTFVAASFTRTPADAPAPIGPGLYPGSRFYRATGHYSMRRTCNTWVAEALAASGCPLSPGKVITAGQLMSALHRACPPTEPHAAASAAGTSRRPAALYARQTVHESEASRANLKFHQPGTPVPQPCAAHPERLQPRAAACRRRGHPAPGHLSGHS